MLDKDIHMLDVNGVVQYSFQAESHYCASWWHDVGKKEKIRVNNICFTDTELSGRLNNGTPLFTKIGCAHMAPNGTNISPPPVAPVSRRLLQAPAPLSDWLGSSADIDNLQAIYNATGAEEGWVRQRWYACRNTTAEGSAERLACHNNATMNNFGIDAEALTLMLHIIQVRPAASLHENLPVLHTVDNGTEGGISIEER
jgi:hypothetical protein